MSFIKFKKNANEWISFYVEAIRNRLRRDKNLSDVLDINQSRINLGLNGDDNITHFHDSHYLPLIDNVKNSLLNIFKKSKFEVSGRATANTVNMNYGNTTTLSIQDIHAETIKTGAPSGDNNMIMMTQKLGDATPAASPECYYNFSTNEIHVPTLVANDATVIGEVNADTIRATKVYNAVWNDYAEFFPRGEETSPGDIIALDFSSDSEQYVKASKQNNVIVGVHSDEFGVLIGGEKSKNNEDFFSSNIDKFIPVALAGRVRVNFIGKACKGKPVAISNIPGVGILNDDINKMIVGYLVEDDDRTDLRKLKIKLI